MADALDVSLSYFDREVRPLAQPQHVRAEGRRLKFYARGVIDTWYASRRTGPQKPAHYLLLDSVNDCSIDSDTLALDRLLLDLTAAERAEIDDQEK